MHFSCQGFPLFCPLIHHPHRICHLHKCYHRDHDIVVKVIIIVILRENVKGGLINNHCYHRHQNHKKREIFKGGFIHNHQYILSQKITKYSREASSTIMDISWSSKSQQQQKLREASSTIIDISWSSKSQK